MSSSRVLHSQIISAIIHCTGGFDKAILYMKKPPTLDLSKVDGLYQSVDATGFEPATSASRTQRSTKLSHASIFMKHFVVSQIVLHYIITSFSVCPEKFCIFLIFLKFQTKPPKIYDIMNSDEFILEVPAELRMRKRQRRKDDIMKIDAVAEG